MSKVIIGDLVMVSVVYLGFFVIPKKTGIVQARLLILQVVLAMVQIYCYMA
jgi:hypothetical protein